jgi:hypothetical protein
MKMIGLDRELRVYPTLGAAFEDIFSQIHSSPVSSIFSAIPESLWSVGRNTFAEVTNGIRLFSGRAPARSRRGGTPWPAVD